MARISTHQIDDNVSLTDKLLGADGNDTNKTKHFTIESIRDFIIPNDGTSGQVLKINAQGEPYWADL